MARVAEHQRLLRHRAAAGTGLGLLDRHLHDAVVEDTDGAGVACEDLTANGEAVEMTLQDLTVRGNRFFSGFSSIKVTGSFNLSSAGLTCQGETDTGKKR